MESKPDGEAEPPGTGNRRRPIRKFVIAAIVLALVGAGVTVAVIVSKPSGPEAAVDRYLTAVKNRDVEAALSEVVPETVEHVHGKTDSAVANSVATRDVFLRKAAMRTDWTFDSVNEHDSEDTSLVSANINGFGKTAKAVFEVTDTADGWKLSDPFAYVLFEHTSLTYLDVDGVRFPDPTPRNISPGPLLPVFPGTHAFFASLPGDVDVSEPGSLKTVMAPHADRDEVSVDLGELTLKGDLLDAARQQVVAYLGDCAESIDPRPETSDGSPCPFEMDDTFEEGDDLYHVGNGAVKWTVTEKPSVDMRDFRGNTKGKAVFAGFETVAREPGTLTATGTAEGVDGTEGDVDFTLECEYAAEKIRAPLDEDDSFTVRPIREPDYEPFSVGSDNDACTYQRG